MLRTVFIIINLCFCVLLQSQTGLSPQGDLNPNPPSQPPLPDAYSNEGIKLHLSTSSYFYDAGENVYCQLMLVNTGNLQPILYNLPCKLSLLNSKGQRVYSQILESSMGSINRTFESTYFKTGGEYTIHAECLLNGKKIVCERKVIIQEKIQSNIFIEVKAVKEQYIPGDSLRMKINVRKSDGKPATNKIIKVIEIFDNEPVDTFSAYTNAKGEYDFVQKINSGYSENNLLYLVKILIDGEWESHIERINLNTGKVIISTFLENGSYRLDKANTLVLFTTNDRGDLTKAACIVYNIKTNDSFFVETNDFGFGKFTLPQGDSMHHYIVFSQKNRNYFYHLQAGKESQAGLSVIRKDQYYITYLLTSVIPEKIRFVSHLRGKVIMDSVIAIPSGGMAVTVSIGSLMPGVMQALVMNNRNEVLAQKLNFINRHKKLKVSSGFSSKTLTTENERSINFKITDENDQPVEGVFNLSITDYKNTLVIEDKQSHISENLLFESDLKYPAKDIGKLWKSPIANNDSLLDLFLNGCELNEIYLPQILQQKKQTTLCYYQFILQDRLTVEGENLKPSVRRIIVKSKKGNYKTTINERNEMYVPADSIIFPCRFFIYGQGHREVFYVNETHAKIALKMTENYTVFSASKDSFYMADGKLPKIESVLSNVRHDATAYFIDGVRMFKYSSYASGCYTSTVLNQRSLLRTGQRSLTSLVGLSSGVIATRNGLSGRGSRVDGVAYYVDGVRVLTPYDSPDFLQGGTMPMRNPGISGGGTSSSGFSGSYYYYRSSSLATNRYSIKKYRPNGTSINEYNSISFEYSNDYKQPKITTYYWATGVTTNSKGEFSKTLKLPKKAMLWHLSIQGIGKNSLCAEYDTILNITPEVYMSLKAPDRLLSTDTADITCTVYNNSGTAKDLHFIADLPDGKQKEYFFLPSGSSKEITFKYNALSTEFSSFELIEENNIFSIQKIEKEIIIEEKYYNSQSINTLVNGKKEPVIIPVHVENTVAKIFIHQSQMIGLENKLLNMISEPHGCFEQVSSTNYPNILAYQYLKENAIDENDRTALQAKKQYLVSGYNKLANYETSTGGFSWYGDGKGNEALTAMGLLQFSKLKKCDVEISSQLVERSKAWLLKSRNSRGVFMQSQGKYSFANTSQNVAHAYITFVLNELSEKDLEQSIEQIREQLSVTPNFYNEALLFAIYVKRGETEKSKQLYDKIFKKAVILMNGKKDHKEPIYTIVNSWYDAALNESLCIIANSIFENKQNDYMPLADKIGDYIMAKDFNALGNMQTKAMGIGTINYMTQIHSINNTTASMVTIKVNDKMLQFGIDRRKNETYDISLYLQKGNNTVMVVADSGKVINSELIVTHYSLTPLSAKADKDLVFSADYKTNQLASGDLVNYNIRIENTSARVLPQTIAIIALPAGVNINPEELLFLKKQHIIDYYEIEEGKLVLYFEEIDDRQEIAFTLPLICEIKGTFDTKGCSIYKYYQAENKTTYLPGRIVIR